MSFKTVETCLDYLSIAGCIKIHPIPSEIHPVLRKVGLSVSNQVTTGDEFTPCLSSENSVIICGVDAIRGIDLRLYCLRNFHNGLNRISKSGS